MKVLTQKNIKICLQLLTNTAIVLLTKLFVLMIGLLSQLFFLEVKILLIHLLKQFLRSISTGKSNEQTF